MQGQHVVADLKSAAVQDPPFVLIPVIHALGVWGTHDDQLVNQAAVGVGCQPGDDPTPVMCHQGA